MRHGQEGEGPREEKAQERIDAARAEHVRATNGLLEGSDLEAKLASRDDLSVQSNWPVGPGVAGNCKAKS